MTDFMQPLLVGEANPHGANPEFALYPLPEHAAGGRLAAILDMSRSTYLRAFRRVNLCPRRWSMRDAREHAAGIASRERGPIVLLGRRVAEAFGFGAAPPFSAQGQFYLLPHPSGLNRVWNDPRAAERARALIYPLLPPRPTR